MAPSFHKTHQINVHNEIKSPVSKKSKVKEGNDDNGSCIDNGTQSMDVEEELSEKDDLRKESVIKKVVNDDEIEMMDVDLDIDTMSKRNDEKVEKLQKRFEEEDKQLKENIKKRELLKDEEVRNLKLKSSLGKKKNKKKVEKDKVDVSNKICTALLM